MPLADSKIDSRFHCSRCRISADDGSATLIAGRFIYRLYDQDRMIAMLGGSRPNPFCECAVVGLRTTFYMMCDIHMTTFELTMLVRGVEFLRGITPLYYSPVLWLDKPLSDRYIIR